MHGPARFLLSALILILAACSRGPAPEETPRPVLVAQPGHEAGADALAYAGEVRAREESALSFRVGGNLVRRDVDVGAQVTRGQLLAELDPGDQRLQAQAAQAQVAAANAELERVRGDRERFARLAGDQLVSRSALDAQDAAFKAAEGQANAARAQWNVARNQAQYTQLRAPRDGVIAARQAEAGQVIAAGQSVFTLAGTSGREVAMAVPESRIREVAIGQPAVVTLWSDPGTRLSGRVREVAPAADPQARTYAVRVALDAAAIDAVALGQSARVFLQGGDAGTGLSLPLSAVQRGSDGATAVWVVDARSAALKRVPVRLGPFGETRVPVLSGVSGADWVVVAGGHMLREGQVVSPVDRQNRPVELQAAQPAATK
ncbi:efflux RND transporter periplasmic adaptor subunit [Luteimonas sp. RIT-PG2_3]